MEKPAFSKFKNQGFSLIEVLVSTACVGILMLGAANVYIMSEHSKQIAFATADATSLKTYLQQNLSKPSNCASLMGLNSAPPSIAAGAGQSTPVSIYQSDGTTPMFTNSGNGSANAYNHLQITNIQFINNSGSGITTKTDVSGSGLQPNHYATGSLQLSYINTALGANAIRTFSIPITFTVNSGNTAVACAAANPDEQTATVLPTCQIGQMMVFDNTTNPNQWKCITITF